MTKQFSKDVYTSEMRHYFDVFHHFNVDYFISNNLDDPLEFGSGEKVANIKCDITDDMVVTPDMYVYALSHLRTCSEWINEVSSNSDHMIRVSYDYQTEEFTMDLQAPFEPVVFNDVFQLRDAIIRNTRLGHQKLPICITESCEDVVFHSYKTARHFYNILHDLSKAVRK